MLFPALQTFPELERSLEAQRKVGFGEALSTGIARGLDESPVGDILRSNEMARTEGFKGEGLAPLLDKLTGAERSLSDQPSDRLLSAEEAQKEFGIPKVLDFKEPVTWIKAKTLYDRKIDSARMQNVIDNASFVGKVSAYGAEFLVPMLDPVAFAAFGAVGAVAAPLTNALGLAVTAKVLGQGLSPAFATFAQRAVTGAVEGAGGMALLTPLGRLAKTSELEDYGLSDVRDAILTGAVGGAVFKNVIPLIGLAGARLYGKAKSLFNPSELEHGGDIDPSTPPPDNSIDVPQDAHVKAFVTALRQVSNDLPVEVRPIVSLSLDRETIESQIASLEKELRIQTPGPEDLQTKAIETAKDYGKTMVEPKVAETVKLPEPAITASESSLSERPIEAIAKPEVVERIKKAVQSDIKNIRYNGGLVSRHTFDKGFTILNAENLPKTAGSMLDFIITKSPDVFYKKLAEKLKGLIDLSMTIYDVKGERPSNFLDNKIGINMAESRGSITVPLHELVHAASSTRLASAEAGDTPLFKSLEEIRNKAILFVDKTPAGNLPFNAVAKLKNPENIKGWLKERGPLSNSSELLAYAFTDIETQQLLSSIKVKGGSGWDAFIHWIGDAVGISINKNDRSLLSEVLRLGGELMTPETERAGIDLAKTQDGLNEAQAALDSQNKINEKLPETIDKAAQCVGSSSPKRRRPKGKR